MPGWARGNILCGSLRSLRLVPAPVAHRGGGDQHRQRPPGFLPEYDSLKEAFVKFINRLPFYGFAMVCGDDPGVQSILPKLERRFFTYGFEAAATTISAPWPRRASPASFP